METTSSNSISSDLDSEIDFEGGCTQALCTSSLSLPAGRVQKTCQLIWLPLLPAIALAIHSSFSLVRDVKDFSRKGAHFPNLYEIETATTCFRSIRRVQTLRYTSTLYLGSGTPEHSFQRFVDESFSTTAKELLKATATDTGRDQRCNFAGLLREYTSMIAFGQAEISVNEGTLKNSCTLKDFIQDSLSQLRYLTVTLQKDSFKRVSSIFGFLIDLMHVDCDKHVAYNGNNKHIIQTIARYRAMVHIEKMYSRMLSIGAMYYTRGYLDKSERSAMIENLRLADDYASFGNVELEVPDVVRIVTAEVLYADRDIGRTRATSFGLVRWTKTMKAFIGYLDGLAEEELAKIKRKNQAERTTVTVGWNFEFGLIAWVVVLCLIPIVTLNATRTIFSIRVYSRSSAGKELQLRREKHKTEALLHEMLPRSVTLKLQRGERTVAAEQYDSATVYFSDVSDFAEFSLTHNPMQVVAILNEIYNFMDRLIHRFDVYKVETISSVYMCVSGIPIRNGQRHVTEIARMSLDIINAAKEFHIDYMPEVRLSLRIGAHTGPAVAGIVGNKMPRYCLFGDTVNTASRMQTNGLPHMVHISGEMYEALCRVGGFVMETRGCISIKGKGKMETYWLLDREQPPTGAEK